MKQKSILKITTQILRTNWTIVFLLCSGVNNAGHSSEFVRTSLRTMVNERTMNNARPPQSPIGQNAMMGPNANVTVNNSINNNTNNVSMSMAVQQQQQQQMTTNSMMNSSDMGGYFDLPTTGKHPSSNSTHYIDWFRLKKKYIYISLALYLLCELNISSCYCQ